ncbi:MAG: type II CAAX endopeptidase family protein [Lutisporaceae bacterium]
MKDTFVMKLNETIIWFSVLILGIIAYLCNTKYLVVLIFWTLIIIAAGNAKRIYSKKYIISSTIIRRSMYVIPFLLPLLTDFRMNLKASNLAYWCVAAFMFGIILILPKLNEWRIVLSKEMIEFTPRRDKIDFITQIGILLGAAAGEEIFFRNFLIGYVNDKLYFFSVVLSCLLFFLNHFGVKWNKAFNFYDYTIQILFSVISSVLFIASKSILPSIIAHAIYNSPLVLMTIKSYAYHYNKAQKGGESNV